MKHLFYTLFIFLFCAATSVTAQTVSQVRNQSTNPTYTPSGAVTSPPLCYNRTTHHLWGYAGGYWYDLTSTPYIDLDPSPTNEKIVSFSVVAGVLRINENGIFYNVPINDIIGAANISSSSPTITVTNVAGVVTVSSTDPDEDATNEIQTITQGYGTIVTPTGVDYTVECDTTKIATQYDLTQLTPPDLCTQIQALPTGTPTPTDKIVYFGGGCFLGDAPAGGVQDTSFWRLTGNAGTDGGSTNFVGTTDAQDFVVKTNSIEIARFGQQGNAAFGSDLTSIAPSLVAPTANNIGSMAFQSGQATGAFSTAFQVSTASGDASVAFGEGNTASGYLSATFGRNNVVNGYYSVVFGENNIVSGLHSAAFGLNNTASGGNSFTFGENNIASGNYSTAFGWNNTSPSDNETTLGLLSTNYTVANNNSDRLFTIGNGKSDILRNNAITLWKDGRSMWNGDVAKQNTWIGVNGTNAQNFINVTTPAGNLAAISTEHTPSGNYAVLGSNGGSSGLVINDTKQFAFTTTAGTTSTQLGSTSIIANYSASGVNIGGNSAATSTLDVTGSFSLPVLIVNATATITSNHCSIECNNGATNITLTLPDPTTCRGRIYMVHRNAGSTGTVTINPGGGLIQELAGTLGATTSISALGSYGQHVWFQSDGTNWLRVN